MKKTICLYGGSIFDGERLYPNGAALFSEEGVIRVIEGNDIPQAGDSFNVHGRLITPGLIDLHSDALEKCIEMRPGIYFDAEFALQSLDRRLSACGITTFYHAVSFADNELGLRSSEKAEDLVRLIRLYSQTRKTTVRHMVHARYEIGSMRGAEIMERLIDEGFVDVISFMDHTPGQGQFKTFQSFMNYYSGTYKITQEEIIRMIGNKKRTRQMGWEKAMNLASRIREAHLPFLSHDDDSPEKIEMVHGFGVTGCEFPITMDAVDAAKARRVKVFMGAPNLIRGQSTNGHLKASETIMQGMCDGLVSDYYPECLLQAPFTASKECSLELQETMKLVTSNPGDYLNQGTRAGRLVSGATADLIVIDHFGPWARIAQTWVSGSCVYNSNIKNVE